jgi:hypothetical protein
MSTLGVIALVTWLVGGLAVGIACAVRTGDEGDDPVDRGLTVLGCWVFAPMVVALVLGVGVARLLGHAVGRVERVHRLWPRPTREALEQQIRELEDETGMGP